MAVTRINNNQITDASSGNTLLGVNAAVKLQNYSITSTKIANNLTYGSDLTISGNLTVNGTTTTVDTVNTLIKDPIITLADGQTSGSPTVDIGVLGLRGSQNSSFLGWIEASNTFGAVLSNTTASNTTVNLTSYGNFTASTITAQANLSVIGNVVGTNTNFTGNITAGNILTPGLISAAGGITSASTIQGDTVSATGNVIGGNLTTSGLISATSTITTTANITGGNLLFGSGIVSGTGNIYANNIFANISGNIDAAGSNTQIQFADTGDLLGASANFTFDKSTNTMTVTGGNVVGGNLLTGGLISATSTITSAANITGANILTGGLISSTGNITTADALNGQTLSLSGNVTSLLNVTSNIAGGNISTPGLVSATGNATVGNLLTGGLISATSTITSGANITGANILTGGLISATGNVTGGNVLTGGLISAGGDITSATNINTPNVVGATGLIISTGAGDLDLQPTGNVVLNSKYINGLNQPVQDNDAASKIYVDNRVSTQIAYHSAVVVATTANLATTTGGTITYTQPNGAANGVGALLTTTGTFNLIDSANVQTVGTRILVKNEGNAAFNGVYTWANATNIVRSIDADQYGPNSSEELSVNDYFFVSSGTINEGSAWIVDAPNGVITFGTSNIAFAQFSQSQVYEANTAAGLVLNATTFSAKVDENTTAFDGGGNIIVKASANLTTPNIGAATGTSLSVTGVVTAGTDLSAVANVVAGNVTTVGLVSATGNVTGGNINTAGLASVTGNVIAGNVTTVGLISATANITGGNILTAGIVSATGNISGGNISTVGNVTASYFIGNILGNIDAAGANTEVQFNDGDLLGASAGFTFNKVGNVLTANGNISGANILTAGLASATGNVTGGNLVTAGNVQTENIVNITANTSIGMGNGSGIVAIYSAGNATQFAPSGQITLGGVSQIVGGTFGGSGFTAGTSQTDLFQNRGGNVTVQLGTGGTIANTWTFAQSGAFLAPGAISATGNITGANLILTSGFIDGPAAGRVTINGSDADVDFAVDGDTVANVFYVDAGTGTASFGNSTQASGALVAFNTPSAVLMPVGNTAQKPAGSTGMLRFNTTDNNLEVFDNTEWTAVGVPSFTVIADEQFNGDGANVAFTLGSTQTTNSCIVSINGIVQIPGTAYSVGGTYPTCVLTFTEAPAVSDLIDVREITTTTTVSGLSNASGNAEITGNATAAQFDVKGNLIPTANITYNLGSNTRAWQSLYVGGNTIYLGNLQLKEVTGQTFAVYQSDGTTQANIDIGNVDVSSIVTGTTVIGIAADGNVYNTVNGTANVLKVTSTGALITGDLSVTGNATLSGNILGDRIQNGTTIIDIQSSGGNANVQIGGTANVAVFATTGLYVGGLISATGNITGGNLLTGGLISAAGNLTVGGDLNLIGNIVDTGPMNLITSSSGNIGLLPNGTGNINTGANIMPTANATANIGSSTLSYNTIFAKATSAQYADLAEKYTADAEYAPGTVVAFGGEAEVTASTQDADHRVAGVVSTNPSYIMNGGLAGANVVTVALTGRVPTSVTGTVSKGDLMVSAGNGRAKAETNPSVGTVIGKALENSQGDTVIEVVVGRF